MSLPAPSPSSTPPNLTSTRRASKREELRSHYGIGPTRRLSSRTDVAPAADGAGEGGRRKGKGREVEGDPLDIDMPAFSAKMYYTNLVTTASLPQLIKASTGLSADVKNLNSGRHSLVYNHHHQLFAAGDTISSLNSRTPELNAIITSLQESFDDISKVVEAVTFPDAPAPAAKDGKVGAGKRESGKEMERAGKRMRLMAIKGASETELREFMEKAKSSWGEGGEKEIRERVEAEMELIMQEVGERV